MAVSEAKQVFYCNEKFEKMHQIEGGRFCGTCNKKIHDFRKLSIEAINAKLAENDNQLCAYMSIFQQYRPFGNWKDKIIEYYQRVSTSKINFLSKIVLTFLLIILMFMTGCYRRKTCPGYIKNTSKEKRQFKV